ncbi:MAG: site-specific integrase [Methanospirillum sp.]|uniref:site-specific integrase n=1 Tax=Methanospirillum sp. TaxID=45200 RepID=UPI002372F694|nr:site-specific integrase [Methanospirillum sp.]MDD1730106.1 site-specific integrase [Methanospirillum sp.]
MSSCVPVFTDNDRFCGVKAEYQDRALAHALESGRITPDDSCLISSFVAERRITGGISRKRILKLVSCLITIRRFIPPYRELTLHTLYRGVDLIQTSESSRGRPFSQNTKIDLIATIKLFSLWLLETEVITIPEKKIRAIKTPKKLPTKTAADILTGDEIEALISGCQTSRDRALLMTMYEGGFRVGELGTMKWGALKFDGTGVIVNVTFKTGKPRYIRLVMAKEHLIKWKSDYPEQVTDESLVFLNERRRPMTHAAIYRQLGRLCMRVGITKHITPHIFRHSRITHLIQQGVGESVIKLMMWGSIDSKMFINYAHLTGTDIDREIFKLYGIEPSAAQVQEKCLEPKVCPHCKEMNSPVSAYCHLCGQALNEEAQYSADKFMEYMLNHRDLMINFLNRHSPPQ